MIVHRVIFYAGFLSIIILIVMHPGIPIKSVPGTLLDYAVLTCGCFLFFYFYAVGFCLVDILWKRWRRIYIWLPLVIVVPAIGPYVYFEKFIFPTYFRRRTPEEWASEPPPVHIVATPRALRRRAAATLFDFAVFFSFVAGYIIWFGTRRANGTWTLSGFQHTLLFLAVWFVYFPMAEGIWAKTLGKALFKMKVIMLHGGANVRFKAAFKRHLLDFVDLAILLGVVVVAASGQSMPRRLGDYWARTIVTLDEPQQAASSVP